MFFFFFPTYTTTSSLQRERGVSYYYYYTNSSRACRGTRPPPRLAYNPRRFTLSGDLSTVRYFYTLRVVVYNAFIKRKKFDDGDDLSARGHVKRQKNFVYYIALIDFIFVLWNACATRTFMRLEKRRRETSAFSVFETKFFFPGFITVVLFVTPSTSPIFSYLKITFVTCTHSEDVVIYRGCVLHNTFHARM